MRDITFAIVVLAIYAASNGTLLKLFDAVWNATKTTPTKAAK